jgi:uncharacterized protein YlxW (UPF0749 family)
MSNGPDNERPNGPRTFQADFLLALFRDPLDPAYAQAAEAARRREKLPRWNRAGRKLISWIVLAAIGLLLAVAYQQVVRSTPEREKVRAGLISRITTQKGIQAALVAEAQRLQADVSRLREQVLGDPARTQQLRQLEAATGMRRVTGDGLVVRMTDGPDAATNKGHRLIDFDLQLVVNALWYYGAEAISINGQRMTALTPIRLGGQTIYVGDTLVVGPYEVSAIGPSSLYDDFSKSDIARLYRLWAERPEHRFGFKVVKTDDLALPAAVMPDLRYAKVPSASGSPTPTPSGGGK